MGGMHIAGDGLLIWFYMINGRNSEEHSIKSKEMNISVYL